MTPSTSLTLEGFLRGLQPQLMWLIGAIITILVIRWIVSAGIARSQENGTSAIDAQSGRRLLNWVAGTLTLLVIAGFGIKAATYATNTIPRSGLDRSSIDRDMNANIKR